MVCSLYEYKYSYDSGVCGEKVRGALKQWCRVKAAATGDRRLVSSLLKNMLRGRMHVKTETEAERMEIISAPAVG